MKIYGIYNFINMINFFYYVKDIFLKKIIQFFLYLLVLNRVDEIFISIRKYLQISINVLGIRKN